MEYVCCSSKYLYVTYIHRLQLVYTREGVCVWPSRKRCIAGKLSLVKQNATPFFTWLPSSHGTATSEASSGSDSANEITDVPFTPVAQGEWVTCQSASMQQMTASLDRLQLGLLVSAKIPSARSMFAEQQSKKLPQENFV